MAKKRLKQEAAEENVIRGIFRGK
jgi:hypothetical protein